VKISGNSVQKMGYAHIYDAHFNNIHGTNTYIFIVLFFVWMPWLGVKVRQMLWPAGR